MPGTKIIVPSRSTLVIQTAVEVMEDVFEARKREFRITVCPYGDVKIETWFDGKCVRVLLDEKSTQQP